MFRDNSWIFAANYLLTKEISMGSTAAPQCKILRTIPELEENAIAKLGSMNRKSYEEFEKEMHRIAKTKKIAYPIMAIDLKFKEGTSRPVSEQPYGVFEFEWQWFRDEVSQECKYTPRVFVVDGSRFLLPP